MRGTRKRPRLAVAFLGCHYLSPGVARLAKCCIQFRGSCTIEPMSGFGRSQVQIFTYVPHQRSAILG
eukprot:scaffold1619_cov161-Amphora_coffeaeformis.AAC.9